MDMASQRPTRLLRRSPLLPGESLESLLERLAVLNYYEPPGLLHRLCVGPERGSVKPDLRSPDTYEQIAALALIEPRELYRASVHSFAPFFSPPDSAHGNRVMLLGGRCEPLLSERALYRYACSTNRARFCPECLEEAAYYRLAWMLVPVAVCLKHECLLVDRCPGCLKPLSVRSIVRARCARCEADLLQSRSLSVAGDAFGLFTQRMIQAWLGLVSAFPESWSYSLPDQPPQVLFRLLEGLWLNLPKGRSKWSHFHRLPEDLAASSSPPVEMKPVSRAKMLPDQAYCVFATAFKGIANWPEGFHEYLDAFRFWDVANPTHSMYAGLGALYSTWIEGHWKFAAYEFVQEAFNRYLAKRYAMLPGAARLKRCRDNPDLGDRSQYMDMRGAARMLGVSGKPF